MPDPQTSRTPGYKAILVAEGPYQALKALQSYRSCGHLPVRFDLKDISSALVEVAFEIPGIQERVLQRALANVAMRLGLGAAGAPTVPPTHKE